MYGLINQAVEDLCRTKFGNAVWDRIRSDAGLPDEPFLRMEKYPDEITYKLVGAACKVLNLSAEAVLKEFGRFWTVYSAEAGYGELLHSVGRTLPEFLKNLDQMHTRIQLAFTHLQPPSFTVSDETPNSCVVHYYSERPGLAPLVIGMLEGLSVRFRLEIDVQHVPVQGARPHDTFHIRVRPAAANKATV
ncbi:MAG: heme NO-binding protein [Planctomycetes bacterium]|nr:heme NO-binding protein [Planctomycetota bacterium]